MAINYGDYARIQGQGLDISPLQQGMESALARNKERQQQQAQQYAQGFMANLMKPLENLAYGDVGKWSTADLNLLKETAGTALLKYKRGISQNRNYIMCFLLQESLIL